MCKCGNDKDFFIEIKGSQKGLYCNVCGKWNKWIGKDEFNLLKHKYKIYKEG